MRTIRIKAYTHGFRYSNRSLKDLELIDANDRLFDIRKLRTSLLNFVISNSGDLGLF